MICFNCGLDIHNNDQESCLLCGVKFALKCSGCGFPNPLMAKYCFNCGAFLSSDHSLSSVKNFDVLSEGRKNVAVIFADVSGFTALSEKLDPEVVRELINDCFNYILKPVYELEGTIDKYIGDCVMILFGARFTHSDDARRSVLCAIKMQQLVKEFSDERLPATGFSLELSIGINYGLVVTGSVGNYFDKDYTVMGDIVNTAQRLQASTSKGSVMVSESVYMETRDYFHYPQFKEIMVKNKEKPVRCYIPEKILDQSLDMQNFPLVDREKELGRLNSIFNRALNTGEKYMFVVGDPGIGKTRLLKEFVSKLGSESKNIWTDCSAITRNRAYYTLNSILTGIMNITPEDSTTSRQRRLLSFLDYILSGMPREAIRRNYQFLGLMLNLARDEEFQSILGSMGVDSIRKEIVNQLAIFFTRLSAKQRLVIVIDDIQWADTYSTAVLKELSSNLSNVNAAFIFTSRYDPSGTEQLKSRREYVLKLSPLRPEGVKELACSLLGCSGVDRILSDHIINYTKGNPLFVKEFVLNLKRSGKVIFENGTAKVPEEKIQELPGSIQALILANLSELNGKSRHFLEAASAIGKDFSLSMASALTGFEINDDIISLPVRMNLILLKSAYNVEGGLEKIYTFSQDAEREVIYESILNKTKREYHKKIAETIEKKYSADLDEYYEILFIHFENAGLMEKAANYCFLSAEKFKAGFNFSASMDYYLKYTGSFLDKGGSRLFQAYRDLGYIKFITADFESALNYLNLAVNNAEVPDQVCEARLLTAEVLKELDRYQNALAILEELEPKTRQDSLIYGKLLQLKCNMLRLMSKPEALGVARMSEKLLLKVRDYESLSETMNQAGIICYIKGDLDKSLLYFNKALKYAKKTNNLAQIAKLSGNLGNFYYLSGLTSKAYELFKNSMDISKKICDEIGCCTALINLGILYTDKGMLDKSEELLTDALSRSQEVESKLNECICFTNLGDIMYERGFIDKARDYYTRSMDMAKKINVPEGKAVNLIQLAKLAAGTSDRDNARGLLKKALVIIDECGEQDLLPDYYNTMAIVESNAGSKQALTFCNKALAISKQNKNAVKKLRSLKIKALIYLDIEKPAKALEVLESSFEAAQQLDSEYELAHISYLRYIAYKKMQDSENAEPALKKACTYASQIDSCKLKQKIMDEL